jgi:hypothetical protein
MPRRAVQRSRQLPRKRHRRSEHKRRPAGPRRARSPAAGAFSRQFRRWPGGGLKNGPHVPKGRPQPLQSRFPTRLVRHRSPSHVVPVRNDVHRSCRTTPRANQAKADARPWLILGKSVEPNIDPTIAVAVQALHIAGDMTSAPHSAGLRGGVDSKCLKKLVGAAGFEPTTCSTQNCRATRLRYTPNVR